MATISNRALTILKDACSVHDFTDVEQARIEVLAEQLNFYLKSGLFRIFPRLLEIDEESAFTFT